MEDFLYFAVKSNLLNTVYSKATVRDVRINPERFTTNPKLNSLILVCKLTKRILPVQPFTEIYYKFFKKYVEYMELSSSFTKLSEEDLNQVLDRPLINVFKSEYFFNNFSVIDANRVKRELLERLGKITKETLKFSEDEPLDYTKGNIKYFTYFIENHWNLQNEEPSQIEYFFKYILKSLGVVKNDNDLFKMLLEAPKILNLQNLIGEFVKLDYDNINTQYRQIINFISKLKVLKILVSCVRAVKNKSDFTALCISNNHKTSLIYYNKDYDKIDLVLYNNSFTVDKDFHIEYQEKVLNYFKKVADSLSQDEEVYTQKGPSLYTKEELEVTYDSKDITQEQFFKLESKIESISETLSSFNNFESNVFTPLREIQEENKRILLEYRKGLEGFLTSSDLLDIQKVKYSSGNGEREGYLIVDKIKNKLINDLTYLGSSETDRQIENSFNSSCKNIILTSMNYIEYAGNIENKNSIISKVRGNYQNKYILGNCLELLSVMSNSLDDYLKSLEENSHIKPVLIRLIYVILTNLTSSVTNISFISKISQIAALDSGQVELISNKTNEIIETCNNIIGKSLA